MSKINRKNFLFLGFAIPEEEMKNVFELDNFPSVQTHKFNWNLIKGLEFYDICDFTYISARPVTDYPSYPKKIIKKNIWSTNINGEEIEIQEIPFFNKGLLKLFSRLCSSVYYSIKNYHKKQNKAGVIVYSVHVPFMIAGLIISRIYKIDYIAIWTDPPAVATKNDSSLKTKLRKIELELSKSLMKRATKIIAVTKYLAEDFAPSVPYLVIEGLIDLKENEEDLSGQEKHKCKLRKIVYTGSLDERYGIKNLVSGFLSLNAKDVILELYGKGNFEKELTKIVKQNHNVVYKGFVKNSEILRIQRDADYLINSRSNDDGYVKYSFPSKTLEYMLSGTPLITTMLPGMPTEYKDYVIVLDNNEPIEIAKKLNEVLKYSNEELKKIGLKALKYVGSKNYVVQGKKIVDFLVEETTC